MHIERHIRKESLSKSETEIQHLYSFLIKIYSNLNEPDGLNGIVSKLIEP